MEMKCRERLDLKVFPAPSPSDHRQYHNMLLSERPGASAGIGKSSGSRGEAVTMPGSQAWSLVVGELDNVRRRLTTDNV